MGVDASAATWDRRRTNANKAAMLAKVNTIIQNAIDLGIYVIVDWHTSAAVTSTGTTQPGRRGPASSPRSRTKYGSSPNVIYETYNEPTGASPGRRSSRTTRRWWRRSAPSTPTTSSCSARRPTRRTSTWPPPIRSRGRTCSTRFTSTPARTSSRCATRPTRRISLGLPLFVTEFGATPSDGGVTEERRQLRLRRRDEQLVRLDGARTTSAAPSWKLDQCTDTSCILTSDAPVDGPWTDDYLTSDTGGTPIDGGG